SITVQPMVTTATGTS
nr:immunoglobulin heavy chain junction region [Mus musculus]